ncbi:hypothetical protein GR925_27400 [Streptomyces sp. HUCO-GS316]|uniref:hypothetical protein n=1 Tax=Streptomyces sp. HUCO-GS316 TaxID=2692198 RepID=UPI001371D3EE|nr:hypothetical protein [Streptomyces sp. HUCO-GS316]MXM67055.1 hypothetical protein [Streptomyces sp. HUCO-GS316]
MTPRAALDIAVVAGEPRPKWCPDCKAETAAAVDLHALLPGGLVYLTTVAVCEICDDPGEAARA